MRITLRRMSHSGTTPCLKFDFFFVCLFCRDVLVLTYFLTPLSHLLLFSPHFLFPKSKALTLAGKRMRLEAHDVDFQLSVFS